jgi:hypothetical protein
MIAWALGTPRDLMLALSFALQPTMPHDAYELLIPDAAGENCYRLGLHGYGSLWGDPALVVPRSKLDPSRLMGDHAAILLDNLLGSTTGAPVPELITVRGPEEPPRSVVAVKLKVVERLIGYLIFGSNGPGFYREEDMALLDRVGALLAPRVEAMVLAWQNSVIKSQLDVQRQVPIQLARVAELLASTAFLGEGSRLVEQQAAALFPVSTIEFAVRLGDDQRVVLVKPGIATPLAELPQEPIEGTGVAAVVQGEVPFLLSTEEDEKGTPVMVLVVSLRTAGRIFGAMAMTAPAASPFSRLDITLAQQFADVLAPHIELARRVAAPPPVHLPGRKRSMRAERESTGQ